MSILEQRIGKNKKAFDVHEPEKGHFDRFKSKLDELQPATKKSINKPIIPVLLKVAAVVFILITVSSILFNLPSLLQKSITDDLNGEIAEMDQYYVSMNQKKLRDIENIVAGDEEMKAMKDRAMHKVIRLQDNTQELKEEYVETNENERVYSALVNNYRLLSTALDKVIDSMNEIKYKKTSN